MTSVKNQDIYHNFSECEANCTGTCYIFGSFGAIEAVANLYYNKPLDLNLSEQHALSCRAGFDCDDDWPHRVYNWVMSHGVVSESDYPWLDFDYPCSEPQNPNYQISITDYEEDYNLNNPDEIKQAVITMGPITATIHYPGTNNGYSHAMALMGYGIIEEDDTIYGLYGQYMTKNDPGFAQHIGKLFWKFKQSYSPFYGANGGYIFHLHKQWPQSEFFEEIVSTVTPFVILNGSIDHTIECHDHDDDGYNNWGISELASVNCIETCSDLADSDDNNPRIAQFDNQYNGTPIMPAIKVYIPLSNINIEPGDIYHLEGNSQNDIIVTFYIENPGTSKLHFDQTMLQMGKITIINENYPGNYSVNKYPDKSLCFGNFTTSFEIKLAAQSPNGSLATIQINLVEPGMEDFEFTMVFNGCETQDGYTPIEGEVTWSDPFISQLRDVHILSNAVLTVEGTVLLSGEADIVVEAGGQLVLDGGKLTSVCLWNGVDLAGDERLWQVPEVQGTIRILNGGTIEFARYGVENAVYNGNEYINLEAL